MSLLALPVSRRLKMSSEGDHEQYNDTAQHAYASYHSCAKLAASLEGIIYVS